MSTFLSSDEPKIRNPYRWLPRKDEKDKKDKKKPSDKSASSESQVLLFIQNKFSWKSFPRDVIIIKSKGNRRALDVLTRGYCFIGGAHKEGDQGLL